MSVNTSLLSERFNEIAAIAACEQQLKQLRALTLGPSGKRYARSRDQRNELWTNLEDTASVALDHNGDAAAQVAKRKRAAKPTPASNKPTTQVA